MDLHTYGNKQNPAVLMLHGPASSYRSLEAVAQLLSAHYYVLVPTLAGSLDGSDDPGYKKQAEQILYELKVVKRRHLHMVYGVSTSCAIVMEMMQSKKLDADYYFFESAPFYKVVSVVRSVVSRKIATAAAEAKKVSFDRFKDVLTNNEMIEKLLGDLNSDYYEPLLEDMYAVIGHITPKTIDALVRSVTDYRVKKVNREIQEKMIFFYGKKGPLWTVRKRMLDTYPFASFISDPETGYCGLMYKDVDQYVQIIKDAID